MAYGWFTYTLPTITGSHSDFPVLLREDDFPSAAIDGGSSSILNGGGNLRAYTSSAKTTRLPIDVVSFVTGATPAVEVWIKIPTAATSNTIHIEADDTETTQPAVTNAYGRNAVWSDYAAVYHGDDLTDSTGNGNTLTVHGAASAGAAGVIGDALGGLDGSASNYYSSAFSTISGQPATIQAWFKPGTDANAGQGICAINRGNNFFRLTHQDNLTGNPTRGSISGTGGSNTANTSGSMAIGSWSMGHATADSDGHVAVFRDGGDKTTDSSTTVSITSVDNLYVGCWYSGGVLQPADGPVDEVRVRGSILSDDWISTEYANQSASGAWGMVGTWADSGGSSSHSIVGSVSVTATPAATLDRQQHPAITGDSPVTLLPSAALDHQIHPAITGDVTLTAVPAATTGFSSGYIIVGDVAVALTPAATLDHQKHPEIVGDSAVSAVPAATMDHQAHPAILGDVALTAVPAATLVYANGDYILGDVSVGVAPASTMDFQRHAGIVGDVSVDITPGSPLDHQIHRALIGDVSIGAVPAAVMEWTEYVPLSLSQADLDAISEAIWSRVIDTLDAEEVMKVLLSAMAGKVSGAETGTIRFRDIADTKDRIVAEVDGNGNRTSVALDVT